MIDKKLYDFATLRQAEYLDAINSHGTLDKAALSLDINTRTLTRGMLALRNKAAIQGYAPEHDMTKVVAEPFGCRGTSTLYNKDGNIVSQWVKTQRNAEHIAEAMREMVNALKEEVPQLKPSKSRPTDVNADLVNLYLVTDYHLGMYAWGEETGADWDMAIASSLLLAWFTEAIRTSPDAEVGILGQLGDFLHFDGLESITPTGGHLLDSDTRRRMLQRVAIRLIPQIVEMMLKKHKQVHMIMAEGNHDTDSSGWLTEVYDWHYANDPRVTVDTTVHPYYCFEWGKTSLFFHHGHKRKMTSLDDVFVAKYREIFGRTDFSYAHMGHLHHDKALETNLMILEQHRTLASPDAYASRGGWMSGRSAKVITYHRAYGEVARLSITPEMLKAPE